MVMMTLYLDTDVQNSPLDSVGENEGGMIWENGIETCILSYVKQIASPGLMHETGCLGLVHWDDPEGWDEEESGVFRMGNPCSPLADLCQRVFCLFSSKIPIVSGLTFKSLIHLEFIFCVWWIHVDVWQNQYNIVKELTSN